MDNHDSGPRGPTQDSGPSARGAAPQDAAGSRSDAPHGERRFDPTGRLLEFQQRIAELLRSSPAGDLERQIKSLMASTFDRMELVTREDFQIQVELLDRLRQRVDVLEAQLQERGAPAADSQSPGLRPQTPLP